MELQFWNPCPEFRRICGVMRGSKSVMRRSRVHLNTFTIISGNFTNWKRRTSHIIGALSSHVSPQKHWIQIINHLATCKLGGIWHACWRHYQFPWFRLLQQLQLSFYSCLNSTNPSHLFQESSGRPLQGHATASCRTDNSKTRFLQLQPYPESCSINEMKVTAMHLKLHRGFGDRCRR